MQYRIDSGNQRPIQSSYFLGGSYCRVKTGTCRGVKICPLTNPLLVETTHCQLDSNWSETLEQFHQQAGQDSDIVNGKSTEEMYQYHLRQYSLPDSCKPEGQCIRNRGLKLIHMPQLVGFWLSTS